MILHNPHSDEKGIALLLVLWIITLLGFICADLSGTMRTETVVVSNFREGTQAYYSAEAGINKAVIELIRSFDQQTKMLTQKQNEEDDDEEESEFWFPGRGVYEFVFEGGSCEVTIEDEENKVGLNQFLDRAKQNPETLKDLLRKRTDLEGEELDTVAAAMIDWKDKDHNITGVHGAEREYYESLDPAYTSRNGSIPVIEELLLIKGIDEELYYGDMSIPGEKVSITADELENMLSGRSSFQMKKTFDDYGDEESVPNPGLINIFSVYTKSQTPKININTASLNQLLFLEGMDVQTAKEIIEERNKRAFMSVNDRLPGFKLFDVWKDQIQIRGPSAAGFYKIKAQGFSPDRRVSRTISANVMLTKRSCVFLSWKIDS